MRPRTWVLALLAVFALLQLANVDGRDTPDSKNYLSYALSLRGDSPREAAAATIDYVCASRASDARRDQSVDVVRFRGPDPAPRVERECRAELWRKVDRALAAGRTDGFTAPFASERFLRIFEARPGYPALLVPFVTVFGVTWGVWLAGVVVAGAGGVLAFALLRALGAAPPVALTGQALYYVLPSGWTAMRPMTEGLLMALTLAALWGCVLVKQGRTRAGAALLGGSLVLLFTVKHSQALFLAACLASAVAVAAAVGRRRPDRAEWFIAAMGAGAAALTSVAAGLLGYPSMSESLQDLLTDHYTRPDRARPLAEFWELEANFWVEWLRRQFWQPLFLTALVAGAWGLFRQRPAVAWLLLAGAVTGLVNQAAHPDINIWGERLIVVAWLLPVLGLPLLLERVIAGGRAAGAVVPGPARGDSAVVR